MLIETEVMTETQEFQEIGKRLEDLREHISIIKREVAQIESHLEEGINHLAAIVQRRLKP
jgi:tetrahydromethanopterin S-methyltransferase subunit G